MKLSGNSFIRFMYNANGNHVEQPKCNIKLWFHEEVLLSATFINYIVVTSICLLQEWETESVVLERVSFICWVIEQA